MATSIDQFGKALVASGLIAADEVKAIWSAFTPAERPKDGEAFAQALVERGKLTKFQAQEILAGRGARLIMGDYAILAEIGAGGMGQVYKAQHRRMNRTVALKVMSAAAMKDDAAVKRFQREVHAAARLEHPNIVTAYDSGEAGSVKYLVMQFVDGGDLSDLVKKNGPLPVEQAVGYVLQAARGLAFAHGEGVIHRDIKPANMLLDKKGVVKILDMGLARFEDGSEGLTATEQVMGTVDYMSPEQAADTKNADGRSDIYSLGCTLWFLLTGRKLYDGDTLVSRLMKHGSAPLPSLVKERDDAPWPLEQAFHKMIEKRPQDRFQTMDEVIAALAPYGGESLSSAGMGSSIGGGGAQSAELASFMKAMAGGRAPSPSKTASPTAPKPATSTNLDATAAFSSGDIGTDPKSQVLSKADRSALMPAAGARAGKRPPSKVSTKLLAAGALGAALLVGGIIIKVRDKEGNVVAEVNAPTGASVEVTTTPAAVASTSAPTAAPLLPPGEAGRRPDEGPPAISDVARVLDSPEYIWSEPENIGQTISGPGEKKIRSLTNDQLRLYFVRKNSTGNQDELWETTRASLDAPFGAPKQISTEQGGEAFVSGDGLTLVYTRRGPGNQDDLMMRRRRALDEPFGEQVDLGPQVNGPTAERRPTLSPDGLTLVFSSERSPATKGDLWISRRASQADMFGPATSAGPTVNSPDFETFGLMLSDNRTLLFYRNTGGWHTTFTNSQGREGAIALADCPFGGLLHFWVAPDGRTAYFSKHRTGNSGGTDIFVTRRASRSAANPSPPAAVVYLDDLPETSASARFPPKKVGKNADDIAELTRNFGFEPTKRSLAFHPSPELANEEHQAQVDYEISGKYARFHATVFCRPTRRPPIHAEVWGDGKPLWKSDNLVSLKAAGALVDVDVRGVSALSLRLRTEKSTQVGNVLWVDPRLTPIAGSRTSAPGAEPAAQLDLLALLDPAKHVRKGTWTKNDGVLASSDGARTSVVLPVDLADSYRLELEAARSEATTTGLSVGLVVGGQATRIFFDGVVNNQRITSVDCFDGVAYDKDEFRGPVTVGPVFHPAGPTKLQIDVTPRSISAAADGKSIWNWSGEASSLSERMHDLVNIVPGELWLGTFDGAYRINKLTYTPLSPATKSIADNLESPDYVWTEPVNLGPTVNGDKQDKDPVVSGDGLCLIYNSSRSGGGDLFESRRNNIADPWGPAVALETVNAQANFDKEPWLSADGLTLLFAGSGTRGGVDTHGVSDLWQSRRASRAAPWETPVNLGPEVNSARNEGAPRLSPDGLTLFFSADRAEQGEGLNDLWRSQRPSLDAPWEKPVNLGPTVNGPTADDFSQPLADGKSLLYLRGWTGGRSIHLATAAADGGYTVRELDFPDKNLESFWLLADGRTMLFASTRPGGLGDADLWMTRRVPKAGAAPPALAAGEVEVNGRRYRFVAKPREGFSYVNVKAGELGGRLAEVPDQATFDVVQKLIPADAPLDARVWLGGKRVLHEKNWQWLSGRPWGFTAWDAQEPNHLIAANANLQLRKTADGVKWVDESYNYRENVIGFIVEWDVKIAATNAAPAVAQVERLTSADYEWSEPESLGPTVNSAAKTNSPTLSDDQLCLIVGYYNTRGEATNGLHELHRKSTNDPWEPAGQVTDTSEGYPSLSADGLIVATIGQNGRQVDGALNRDLILRTRAKRDEPWGPKTFVASLNAAGNDYRPVISPDGLALVFGSERPGGVGKLDLWISRRADRTAEWSPPVHLGDKVNTTGDDHASQILADGTILMNRDGDLYLVAPDDRGGYELRPVPLPTTSGVGKCWLSPDGATLYFDNKDDPNDGDKGIRLSRRVPKAGAPPAATGK